MTDRSQPKVADGEPFAGDFVAVVDESAHGAGGGVYYVVGEHLIGMGSAPYERLREAGLLPPL